MGTGWLDCERAVPVAGAQWTVTGLTGTLALALAATGTFSGSKTSFWVSEPGWQGTGWRGVTVVKDSGKTVIVWIVVAGRTGTRRSPPTEAKQWDFLFFQIGGREDARRTVNEAKRYKDNS
ncbi:hypothetical protein QR685DRAFT_184553 [Neurospora intermedia]|uniref:Uncharacterized protein n=1 Tax=Neurospora intermedia TaxID=5142 RepID=A0ABR3DM61_NEUIN